MLQTKRGRVVLQEFVPQSLRAAPDGFDSAHPERVSKVVLNPNGAAERRGRRDSENDSPSSLWSQRHRAFMPHLRLRAPETEEKATPPQKPDRMWLGIFLALLTAACVAAPTDFKDVCAEANYRVQSCGASVPLLTDSPCTGIAKFLSQCVTDHSTGCDDLAALMRSPDSCFPDAGDSAFPGAEEIPFPAPKSLDGGTTP